MRLGQIARKLDITPAELGAFLQSQFGLDEWGTNSRLSEEQLTRVMRHFAPDQADRFFQISKADEPELPATPEPAARVTPVPESHPDEPPNIRPDGVEVIKAARVELSGLKVLGKIELPEKKKKEAAGDQPEKFGEEGSRPPRRRPPARDERPRPQKNPIALQREREEREALRRKQEEAQRQKEKKANRYFKAIQQKPVKVTKAARLVEEELEVANPEPEKPAPKTWWGRFLQWLNT